jgi:hypothetical protein
MRLTRFVPIALALVAAITATSSATASTRSEHFSLITTSTSATNHDFSAIATGAFADGGTALVNNGTVTMRLSAGTLTLALTANHQSTTGADCAHTKTIRGTYQITGGTGAYAAMQGSGNVVFTVTVVEANTNGTCSTAPIAAQGIVTAEGAVSQP